MNLLLANLHWNYGVDLSLKKMGHLDFCTGLAIIAGEIREKRNDTLFVLDNYVRDISEEEIDKFIEKHRIDCILLSMYLGNFQYKYLKRFILHVIKIFPHIKIIIGGPMASTIPDVLLGNIVASDKQIICVVGEGEYTIIDLLNCISAEGRFADIKGIVYKEGLIIHTAARERIKNLDIRTKPAYELFDMEKYLDYIKAKNRCWEMITSRGCYGSCTFCKLVFGQDITMRSAASIVSEMEEFYKTFGINRFNFVDDNFLNSENRVWDFYNALKKSKIQFKWRFQGRADRLHPDLAKALMDVGLFDVMLGIESGSPEILKEMNKNLDLEVAKNYIQRYPSGLDTHGTFVVGMPGESEKTIKQTEEFIKESGLKYITAGILTIFPGTHIYRYAMNKGYIPNEDIYCENLGPIYVKSYINLTKYTDDQLLQWRKLLIFSGKVVDHWSV
ncbi:MAG: radical SAM protein [Candidatus Omnitrophota bacterium]|jgi:radical SAM superfamily enzyme YgiQ (UPF0313 family)